MKRVALFLIAAFSMTGIAAAKPAHTRPAHHPAKVTDWSRITAATPSGGYVMGNPGAKVKLIEYGSLTCSHCRHFDETGVAPLVANYVKTGRVSWEFRPFLISGFDIPATLTASCNGAASFFPTMRALYAAQPGWIDKMQAIPDARLAQIQAMSPEQQTLAIGQAAGFPAFAAARGVPATRTSACLANKAEADKLVRMTGMAVDKLKVNGTPTFFINGVLVDYSAGPSVWGAVQSRLDAALKS